MGKTLCQQSAFKLQSDVYETFVSPEESFLEGPFYMQTTQNLQMFHEWGPLKPALFITH